MCVLILFYFNIGVIWVLFNQQLHAQVLQNNGGFITAEPGAFITVNGSVENESNGIINVDGSWASAAELYVTENITNNGLIEADGNIRLLGNWFNNNNFSTNSGTVFLEGANQLIGGTSESHFFNLIIY